MRMPTPRCLLITLLLLMSQHGIAQTTSILAGLDIANYSQQLDFGTSQRDTRIDTFSIYWYETLSPRIMGGFVLGYQDITQTSNPIVAGQALSGEFLGLSLHIEMLQTQHLSVYSDFRYRYSQAFSSQSGQDIDWQWQEGQAEVGVELKVGQSMALGASAGILKIDGRERATGTVDQVTDFDSADDAYARANIKLLLDPYSHIGIEGTTGAIQGGTIYFRRYF